ncbi:MAG TPA: hypothetical protein VEV62_03375 [Parafilimonas sp.]|jgi:predicted transcriptional regulator|nr:hypothetical protein [Parafilimonas sp.]
MTDTEMLRNEVRNYIDKADAHVLKMMYAMLKADSDADWWDELEEEEKKSIEQGLDDLKKGKIISHDEIIEKHSEWFLK